MKTEADELKQKGNEAYQAKDYAKARQFYTQAIGIFFLFICL